VNGIAQYDAVIGGRQLNQQLVSIIDRNSGTKHCQTFGGVRVQQPGALDDVALHKKCRAVVSARRMSAEFDCKPQRDADTVWKMPATSAFDIPSNTHFRPQFLAICIRETIRPTDNKISFSMEPAVCALLKEQQNCCCQSLG
jgi:hypothetical protein